MNQLDASIKTFLQYGVSSELAQRAAESSLTVTKIRALSLRDLEERGLNGDEAKFIKNAVSRQPIDPDTLDTVLERSNYTCAICHGVKGSSFIVHHIRAYAQTQDNAYDNLIVLCPNDHDLAHGSGLTMRISPQQLSRARDNWHEQVEKENASRAARCVKVDDGAIDYINVRRIEELCLQLFGRIPHTSATETLKAIGIINEHGLFQQRYVQENLSCGAYLFDYVNAGETSHYRELMFCIGKKIEFDDLNAAVDRGRRHVAELEGHYTFFVGGVYSQRPALPITSSTPSLLMHYTKRRISLEWTIDPNFLVSMSAITRQGGKNRYIIYSLLRTIDTGAKPGSVVVTASPLLIGQPSVYANRIPPIGWHRFTAYQEACEIALASTPSSRPADEEKSDISATVKPGISGCNCDQ